jgi:hypothetical protein
MPSPERPGGERNLEHLDPPYYHAARFPAEPVAWRAYSELQVAISLAQSCDLSGYRFQLGRSWHVVVLGDRPSPDLDERIQTILANGRPASVPRDFLKLLYAIHIDAV